MSSELRINRQTRLSIPTVLVSAIVAVVLSAITALYVSSRSVPSMSNGHSVGNIVEGIVERLGRLEQQHRQNPSSNDVTTSEPKKSAPESASDDGDIRGIEQRVARLEEFANAQQEAGRREAEAMAAMNRRMARYEPDEAIRIMSDPSSNDEMKTKAWRSMRYSESELWTDSIVLEAVRIGTTADDPEVRADIWRQAHGNATHPLLVQPLLQSLANDLDPRVRAEAAETLDLYLDQAGVREALQAAANHDEHRGVRQQARSSLNGPNERN